MLNKIYSLLASILLLSACVADEVGQEKSQVDASKTTVSFQVDIPTSAVITKSLNAPGDEVGVSNLQLITFDGNGSYIATVPATNVSGNSYSASISKETRKVQFVANYDEYASIKRMTDAASVATTEYAFFAEQTLLEGFTSLSDVELLRNWSKFSLMDDSKKLSDIQFMVYNASSKATVAPGNGNINIPAENTLNTDQSQFVDAGTDIHAFEQTTSGDKPAFMIVKARYNGSADYTYYKLDLAVTNPSTGVVTNYDIIRNYWYKITISSVQRKGVTWDEVIKSGKIADNNITASAELDKYPSISFGGETLEVTKTTFVFTKASETLDMLATYTNTNTGGTTGYNGLQLIQESDLLSNVVQGGINMTNEKGSGRIKASIKNPSSTEQVSYFYVKGGNLQRKITLILRNPYEFKDVHFYKTSNVNDSYTEGLTNKITEGPDNLVWLGFTIPDDVDASIFPLECKIKSTTLYAVTDGVRIETDPADDKVYYYVYTAKNAGRHSVEFKTNATVSGETANLTAEYFKDDEAKYVTDAPLKIGGTAKYGVKGSSKSYNISGTVYYKIGKDEKSSFNVSGGSYSNVNISRDYGGNTPVILTYTKNEVDYTYTTTLDEWKNNGNIILTTNLITGTLEYATGPSSSSNITGNVQWSTASGKKGTITVNDGTFIIDNQNIGDEQITFVYEQSRTNGSVVYRKTVEVSDVIKLLPYQLKGTTTDFTNGATVNKYKRKKGDEYGSITISSGKYVYTLPNEFSWSQNVRMYQSSKNSETLSLKDWITATNMNMSKD